MTERDDYWLNDEELASFMSLMSVNIRLTNILDAQLRDDAGLSFFEYTVLSLGYLRRKIARCVCVTWRLPPMDLCLA